MTNSISLVTKYIPIIDQVYAEESKTAVLERPEFVRNLDGANAVKILRVATDGLGDYSRSNGFVDGGITAAWETHTLSQDRGRRFLLDAMDNEETLGLTLGATMREFMRTDVTPEIDAYRFAKLASKAGIANTDTGGFGNPTGGLTSTNIKSAVDAAMALMREAEVNLDGGTIFITPTKYEALKNASGFTFNLNGTQTQGRDMRFPMYDGLRVVQVPQTRFYTAISLKDGSTTGETAGGYAKSTATGSVGKNINFMIVAQNACLPVVKHNPSNLIRPEDNQTADAWIMKYRIYHDLFVPTNKTKGIYLF